MLGLSPPAAPLFLTVWLLIPPPPHPPPALQPKPAAKPAPAKPAPKAAPAPAAAAGASALARALVDAPPRRPDGKRQSGGAWSAGACGGGCAEASCCLHCWPAELDVLRTAVPLNLFPSCFLCHLLAQPAAKKLPQAAAIKQQPHELVPEAAAAAAGSEVQRFAFDRPSPDDVVQAAQQQKGPGVAPKPYNPIRAQQQAQQAQQTGEREAQRAQQGAADAAAAGLQGLSVGDAGPPAAQPAQQAQQRRPLSEYRPDAELAAACTAAATAEQSGGGKPRLHLVVLGHVDAGKSTLMGRMLYELGLISDKAVHKTQVGGGAGWGAGAEWVVGGGVGGCGRDDVVSMAVWAAGLVPLGLLAQVARWDQP